MKEHILNYLGLSSHPQAVEKVLAIARTDANQGHSRPRARLRCHETKQSFDTLVSFFDASRDPDTRRHIVELLGMSRDPRAGQKLFSIAQSDPDPELRRTAVDFDRFSLKERGDRGTDSEFRKNSDSVPRFSADLPSCNNDREIMR